MSGIINFNKPRGRTSFSIIAPVRRGTGQKRVGHAGTLDPLADGVLLICLGSATRVTEYLMDLPKTYRGTIHLGVETDTYDAEGAVTATQDVSVSEEQVREALSGFLGEIEQRPPAHSSVKVDGRRAYDRARRGEEIEMKPRKVQVHRIDLTRFDPPDVEIDVECSRGTYIRSLAHDIGEALRCGGHLSALTRTRVGPFRVEDAIDEPTLLAALEDGAWREHLQPIDCGLLHLPALTVPIEDEKDLRHGQPAHIDDEEALRSAGPLADGIHVRGYAEDGSLIGILRYEVATGNWRPHKIFPTG
ncbi:MAG TPA: tRNA pseudouridine(55) synthase TruB [Dehalococcoidia bacterium]|nr:tRNA pseudouridine(55) synthase TruB [Dehalococcoidia bacterium]